MGAPTHGARNGAVDGIVDSLTRGYGLPAAAAARVPFVGSPAQAAERIAAYGEAGVTHLVLNPFAGDWRRQADLVAEACALLGRAR